MGRDLRLPWLSAGRPRGTRLLSRSRVAPGDTHGGPRNSRRDPIRDPIQYGSRWTWVNVDGRSTALSSVDASVGERVWTVCDPWGSRGRGFKSRRPDRESPVQKANRAFPSSVPGPSGCLSGSLTLAWTNVNVGGSASIQPRRPGCLLWWTSQVLGPLVPERDRTAARLSGGDCYAAGGGWKGSS